MTAIANVLAQVFPASSTQTDVLKQLALFLRSRLALAIAGLAKRLQLRSNRRALAANALEGIAITAAAQPMNSRRSIAGCMPRQ